MIRKIWTPLRRGNVSELAIGVLGTDLRAIPTMGAQARVSEASGRYGLA